FVYGFTPVAAAPYVFLGNAAAPAHPCALSLHDALPILSAVAFWKTPITSDGREGFVELRLPGVVTFCPPSHMGYSRPNSDFTFLDRKSTRLNSSHRTTSYAVFCLKNKTYRWSTSHRRVP